MVEEGLVKGRSFVCTVWLCQSYSRPRNGDPDGVNETGRNRVRGTARPTDLPTFCSLVCELTGGFTISGKLHVGGTTLPFHPQPSGSIPGRTVQGLVCKPKPRPWSPPDNAASILILLIDDATAGLPRWSGGELCAPTRGRITNECIDYSRFRTTATCSPALATLLNGLNRHMVGNSQIVELANGWDGYSEMIPGGRAFQPEKPFSVYRASGVV
jgi:hypothetical protein